jgi:hypothetical protein
LGEKNGCKEERGLTQLHFKELSVANASDFQNYIRLPVDLFDSLMKKIMPLIQKQDDGIVMKFICNGIHLR